jgi:hypothetical protein
MRTIKDLSAIPDVEGDDAALVAMCGILTENAQKLLNRSRARSSSIQHSAGRELQEVNHKGHEGSRRAIGGTEKIRIEPKVERSEQAGIRGFAWKTKGRACRPALVATDF